MADQERVAARRGERLSRARQARPGFSLIELLVVIAILALLAAILFPIAASARDSSRRSVCLSNLRQIALAHLMYVQDNDDTLPFWYVASSDGVRPWPLFLRPYYRDPRILDQGFTDPSTHEETHWLADYSLCAWGPGGSGTQADPYWRWPGAVATDGGDPEPMNMAEVRRPGESMQFADGYTDGWTTAIRRGHLNGQLNGSFLDGHARRITDSEWNQIGRDAGGYFYRIAAADR